MEKYVGWMDGLMKSFVGCCEEICQSDRDGAMVDFKIGSHTKWRPVAIRWFQGPSPRVEHMGSSDTLSFEVNARKYQLNILSMHACS